MAKSIAPGWYADPAAPETQRYWDGEQWIGDPLPADATPPPGPPPPRTPAPPPAPGPAGPMGPMGPMGPIPPGMGGPGGPGDQQVPLPLGAAARRAMGLPPLRFPDGFTAAPLERRLGARVVDILVVGVLSAVANAWLGYQYVHSLMAMFRQVMADPNSQPEPDTRMTGLLFGMVLISLALWFGYEVLAVARSGQTLGKRLFAIKVVRMDGAAVDFRVSLRRWSVLALPNLLWPCCLPVQAIDVLWCTWDRPLQQCIHDKSALTVVVRAPRADAEKAPKQEENG